MPDFTLEPEIIMADGKPHRRDSQGGLVPLVNIKAQHLLEDEMVRKIVGYAVDLNAQIARFKDHTFADIDDFLALLAQEYGEARGGKKGNMTFMSYDGCLKVQVQVADLIEFGPELQVAKGLFDECVTAWSQDARDELRVIITKAFNTEKAGQINRAEILSLLRLEIEDERWQNAVRAIHDAMRTVGTKSYVRVYRRDTPDGAWRAVTVDLAKA